MNAVWRKQTDSLRAGKKLVRFSTAVRCMDDWLFGKREKMELYLQIILC